jgi:hypothetical protein
MPGSENKGAWPLLKKAVSGIFIDGEIAYEAIFYKNL